MCLNASRSRDVEDAIPYMVGVFHKDAIPYIFMYGWILINLGTCLNATRSRDVGDANPYTVGTIYKDAIPLHGRYVLQGKLFRDAFTGFSVWY